MPFYLSEGRAWLSTGRGDVAMEALSVGSGPGVPDMPDHVDAIGFSVSPSFRVGRDQPETVRERAESIRLIISFRDRSFLETLIGNLMMIRHELIQAEEGLPGDIGDGCHGPYIWPPDQD